MILKINREFSLIIGKKYTEFYKTTKNNVSMLTDALIHVLKDK